MADQSDVERALVTLVSGILYPNGVPAQTPPAPSIAGAPARIYRGWPNGRTLDQDLAAGIFNVTVYAPPGMERNTSRFPSDWQYETPAAPALTASVIGSQVLLGGAAPTPLNIAVKIGRTPYVYSTQPGDTPASIATALAALIAVDYPSSTSEGAAIYIANPAGCVSAAVGGFVKAWRELRRQQRLFQIITWAPTPDLRDLAVSAVDAGLAGIERFTLADDAVGRLIYVRTTQNDAPQKERLFRRDLFYSVEYPTSQTTTFAQVVAFTAQVVPLPGVQFVAVVPTVVAEPKLAVAIPVVGTPLVALRGVYTGDPAPTVSGQWRYADTGLPIIGATALTYTPVQSDLGRPLQYVETISNDAGLILAAAPVTTPVLHANYSNIDPVLDLSTDGLSDH